MTDAEYEAALKAMSDAARKSIREVILKAMKDYEDGQKAQAEESAEDSA